MGNEAHGPQQAARHQTPLVGDETAASSVLENTYSLCPVCMKKIPAAYLQEEGAVYLDKTCAEHGHWHTLVWEEGPDFSTWDSGVVYSRPANATKTPELGCPYDCGLCSQHAQAACCVLIEITQRCNQACPYCFASSTSGPEGTGDYTLEEMENIFRHLQTQSPQNQFNIQLSGGEPTLHEDLPQIISMAKHMGFPYVQLNTNGKRLAEEPAYAQELQKAGLDSVFLQFDGTNDTIYTAMRGQPLFAQKEQAIDHCASAGLGVVLVVTVVKEINGGNIGEVLRYASGRLPLVNGVHFQPVSYFGRFPTEPRNSERVTIPGLFQLIHEQTDGLMSADDFVPLASGHGRCSFHGNFLLSAEGGYQGLSGKNEEEGAHKIEKARAYLAKKWGAPKAAKCCCEEEPDPLSTYGSSAFDVEEWDSLLDTLLDATLNLTAMAFQDIWTVDLKRLNRCRLHVATRDLELIPFCAFNLTSQDGKRLHSEIGRN
ncbi:radical SAM protein [Ruminococcaceae bacterium OttesenSCG-928-I18]|nr:radical SAM protein [Ruminococcaceae bacterium OttesenSCG-928-I18]